jgi:hypothetical protein
MDMQLPKCLELADWEDMPVPRDMRAAGIVRVVAWPCFDPDCPVPVDDDGSGKQRAHFLMFKRGQDAGPGFKRASPVEVGLARRAYRDQSARRRSSRASRRR